ncbi:MAG: hypothetical protein M0R46_14515 [Candidatus Muirbacterium halophilum]|nr:hypothetical protein [Candidatus Muirbacterium halophilum]
MNKRISFFKKIKMFNHFKKIIKASEVELDETFNIKVDKAYRLYTVINVPIEEVGEPYNLRKSDIDAIAETRIKDFSSKLAKFLNSKGLAEMYNFYEIKKVEKYSYLIVIGFDLPNEYFRSNRFYDNLYYKVIPITFTLIILIILLIKLL